MAAIHSGMLRGVRLDTAAASSSSLGFYAAVKARAKASHEAAGQPRIMRRQDGSKIKPVRFAPFSAAQTLRRKELLTPIVMQGLLANEESVELNRLGSARAVAEAEAEGLTLVRSVGSKSGFKGVWCNVTSYHVHVQRGGKQVYLGSFATAEEAALCYARTPEAQAGHRDATPWPGLPAFD